MIIIKNNQGRKKMADIFLIKTDTSREIIEEQIDSQRSSRSNFFSILRTSFSN
jgi:hypothetical protein